MNYIHERDVTWIWLRHGLQVWQPALILPKNTTHLGLKSRWVDDINPSSSDPGPLKKPMKTTNICGTKMFNSATTMQRKKLLWLVTDTSSFWLLFPTLILKWQKMLGFHACRRRSADFAKTCKRQMNEYI